MKRELIKREWLFALPFLALGLLWGYGCLFLLKAEMGRLYAAEWHFWNTEYNVYPAYYVEQLFRQIAENDVYGTINGTIVWYGSLFMKQMSKTVGEAGIWFAIGAFLFGNLLIMREKLAGEADFLYSLPVSRKKLIQFRIQMAVSVVILIWGVLSAGILLQQKQWLPWLYRKASLTSYSDEILANENAFHALCFLGILLFVTLACLAVGILVQLLIRKSVFALAFGVCVLAAPMYISGIVNHYLLRYADRELPFYGVVQNLFRPEYVFAEQSLQLWDPAVEGVVFFQFIEVPAAKVLIYAAITLLVLLAVLFLYARHGIYNSRINRFSEMSAIWLISFCIGLMMVRVESFSSFSAAGILVVVILVTAAVGWMLTRLLRQSSRGRRREKLK